MIINDMEVSSANILKLVATIESEIAATISKEDQKKIQTCLNGLRETSQAFSQNLTMSVQQLAQTLIPRIKPSLDIFSQLSYELTEQMYADYEVNDPFAKKLISQLEALLQPYQKVLLPATYNILIQQVVIFFAQRLEQMILTKTFNQIGGLQLDRDLRALVSFFTSLSSRTVRDRFQRINQIGLILTLENANEIVEYWGDKSFTWRLSAAEIRQVLLLRIDFNAAAVKQLKLV